MYFNDNVHLYTCPKSMPHSQMATPDEQHQTVASFYKCSPVTSTNKQSIQCFFATNVRRLLTDHMKKNHKGCSFRCVYCFTKKNRYFTTGIELLRHIDTVHKNRFFQCDVCIYRAITADHVNLHQVLHHCERAMSERRILFCQSPPFNPQLTLKSFYDTFKVANQSTSQLQCLYCLLTTDCFESLLSHLTDYHPDYPLLYYVPEDVQDISSRNVSRSIALSEDEQLLTSDEEESITYVCFFCDTTLTSKDGMKIHLSRHLFGNTTAGGDHDVFFHNWINWFVSTQHSYADKGRNCPLCHKLENSNSRVASRNTSVSKQKVHYVLHSCYKPIKCNLCPLDNRGDFWLPNLMRRILTHLNQFHKPRIETNRNLRLLTMDRFKATQRTVRDWTKLKRKLLAENVISEFSTRGEQFQSMCAMDKSALKVLETQYFCFLNRSFKGAPRGKPPSLDDLFTDDESD